MCGLGFFFKLQLIAPKMARMPAAIFYLLVDLDKQRRFVWNRDVISKLTMANFRNLPKQTR